MSLLNQTDATLSSQTASLWCTAYCSERELLETSNVSETVLQGEYQLTCLVWETGVFFFWNGRIHLGEKQDRKWSIWCILGFRNIMLLWTKIPTFNDTAVFFSFKLVIWTADSKHILNDSQGYVSLSNNQQMHRGRGMIYWSNSILPQHVSAIYCHHQGGRIYLRSCSTNICVVDVCGSQFVQCGQLSGMRPSQQNIKLIP
jgi:hypothetical protein